MDPIEAAETLVRELRESHHRNLLGSIAIHQREQSAKCLENLIEYVRGYRDGTAAETSRLVRAASALLSQIAKLQDALDARKRLGLPENDRDQFTREWINGSAPRLWTLADELRGILKR
jgi:hypothetical protein